jgi:hypothetical protein
MLVQLVQRIQFVPITRIAQFSSSPVCPVFSGVPRGSLSRVEHLFVSGANHQVNVKDPYYVILSAAFPIPRDGGHEWEFFFKNTACFYLKRA